MYRSISDFTDGGYRVETALWSPASSTFVGRPYLPGSAPRYSFKAIHTSGGCSVVHHGNDAATASQISIRVHRGCTRGSLPWLLSGTPKECDASKNAGAYEHLCAKTRVSRGDTAWVSSMETSTQVGVRRLRVRGSDLRVRQFAQELGEPPTTRDAESDDRLPCLARMYDLIDDDWSTGGAGRVPGA